MEYGILKNITNNGLPSELQCRFSTPLTIISNQPSYAQDMLNLKRKTSSQNIQRWEIEANLAPTNDSPNFLVHSVLNGHSEKVYARMPQVQGVTPSPDGILSAAILAGNKTFDLVNAQSLTYGEFIQFENHSKIYLVTDPGALGVDVKIAPALLQDVPTSTPIRTGGKVTLHAYYNTSVTLGIKYTDGIISDPGSVTLLEDIPTVGGGG